MGFNKKEYQKIYYQTHRKELLDKAKDYNKTHNEKRRNYHKTYYSKNKTILKDKMKEWYENNKEHHKSKRNEYYATVIGRANALVNSYKTADREKGRGEVDFDRNWLIENIFSSKCIYCGESDWTKLGCDRIDNSKPHIKCNVVPCCEKCNKERRLQPHIYFLLKKKGYFN